MKLFCHLDDLNLESRREIQKMRSLLLCGLVFCIVGFLSAESAPPTVYKGGLSGGPPLLPAGTRGYLLFLPKEAVSGLEPSEQVDISVSYGAADQRIKRVVVNNVLLVAIGKGIGKYEGSIVITLAVTPNDAEKLDRVRKKSHAKISVQKTSNERQ